MAPVGKQLIQYSITHKYSEFLAISKYVEPHTHTHTYLTTSSEKLVHVAPKTNCNLEVGIILRAHATPQ
jgi:hypothetical protein